MIGVFRKTLATVLVSNPDRSLRSAGGSGLGSRLLQSMFRGPLMQSVVGEPNTYCRMTFVMSLEKNVSLKMLYGKVIVVLLYHHTSDLLQVNDARKQHFTLKSRNLENIQCNGEGFPVVE